MANPFQIIITGNTFLDRIQANITNAFNSFVGPFIGGTLLPSVYVGTGATAINHGLGRVPTVWVICDQNTLTDVARTAWDKNTITLEAGTACVISLYVN
jgi:hypothetical protein